MLVWDVLVTNAHVLLAGSSWGLWQCPASLNVLAAIFSLLTIHSYRTLLVICTLSLMLNTARNILVQCSTRLETSAGLNSGSSIQCHREEQTIPEDVSLI